MIETIFITCWLVLMSDGSLFCHCEGEPVPVVEATEEVQKPRPEAVREP